jgi:hypothetical protein
MGAVFFGGLLRWYLGRNVDEATRESRREKGVLFGSGLVGGGGLTGVILAVWVVAVRKGEPMAGMAPDIPEWASMLLAAATIAVILGIMGYYARQKDA